MLIKSTNDRCRASIPGFNFKNVLFFFRSNEQKNKNACITIYCSPYINSTRTLIDLYKGYIKFICQNCDGYT